MTKPQQTHEPRRRTWLAIAMMAGPWAAQAQVPSQAPVDPVALPELQIEGAGETARGPVSGYVARQSATGTKTDTPLLETPQSVSVITRDRISAQNAQSIGQAFRYTAGTSIEQYGEDTRGEYFTIRGLAGDIYLDGLRVPASSGFNGFRLEPFGLERLEVLRGAASGLFGQASPGGVINGVSLTPQPGQRNMVSLQAGSFNRIQGSFDVGGALNQDRTLLWRFNGLVRDSDTQVSNVFNDRIYLAPSVRWQPRADVTITVLGSYLRDNTGSSAQFLPPSGTVLPNPNGRISRSLNTGDPNFDRFVREQATIGYMAEYRPSEAWTVRQNARFTHQNIDYTSIYPAAGQTTDRRAVIRGVGYSTQAYDNVSVDNQLETRFGTGPLRHTLLAGFDYRWQFNQNRFGSGTGPGLDFFAPVYGVPITRPSLFRVGGTTLSVTNNNQFLNQFGLYAQDQIRLGNWLLTLTGRQDYASIKTRNNLNSISTSQDDSAFTGRVGLLYASPLGLSPYVSYSTSFLPATGTLAPQRGGGTFQPTTGEQIEIGLKYQPPGMNSFITAAAYDLTQANVSTTDPLYRGFSIQTGQVRSRGLEFEATVNLFRGLNLIGALTVQDTEVTRSTTSTLGNRPIAVPNHTAAIWADYSYRVNEDLTLGLGGGVRYTGNTLGNNVTGAIYHVPSYTLLDGMLRADWRAWRLQVNATNLTDQYYVAACSGGANCAYGTGRSVYTTLSYRW